MRLMMGLFVLAAVGCNDKDTGDSDVDTGTDVDTEAPLESVTVSGSVSGLFNGDAVLQINGGMDVTVTEDGAFSFDDALLETEDFDVTVLTAPAGQSCTVVGGAGTAQADVTDVEVLCTCDFAPGVADTRPIGDVQINDSSALNYNAITFLRGEEGTVDWTVACGSERQTLLRSSDAAPDVEGTAVENSVVLSVEPWGWSNNTAWAVASLQPGRQRGRTVTSALYRAAPPSWEPEAVLYTGVVIDSLTVPGIYSSNIGTDGVVAALVEVDDGVSRRLAVAKVDGESVSIVFDIADGVDVDGMAQPVCNLGEPVWSADGHMAVPVAYGNACLTRGLSRIFYNGVVAVSGDTDPRMVVESAVEGDDGGPLYELSDVHVDDVGHVVFREWRCPTGERCVRNDTGTGVAQVDLQTGALVPVARFGDAFGDAASVAFAHSFDVATTGEVAIQLTTYPDDCRRGCSQNDGVGWWDGALREGVANGQSHEGYVVNRDFHTIVATSNGRMGVVADVFQGQPNNGNHQAMMCWDAESGSTLGLGRGTNGQTDIDVNTVLFNADINGDGHFAAVVDAGDPSSNQLMLGACP